MKFINKNLWQLIKQSHKTSKNYSKIANCIWSTLFDLFCSVHSIHSKCKFIFWTRAFNYINFQFSRNKKSNWKEEILGEKKQSTNFITFYQISLETIDFWSSSIKVCQKDFNLRINSRPDEKLFKTHLRKLTNIFDLNSFS